MQLYIPLNIFNLKKINRFVKLSITYRNIYLIVRDTLFFIVCIILIFEKVNQVIQEK